MSTLWHPDARRVIIPEAPQGLLYTGGGRKVCWHTTEPGNKPRPIKVTDIDGAVGAYHANGNCPTFTIQVVGTARHTARRKLYQHLPINRAASALKHIGQPTNTANVIQVEIVQFAAVSDDWPDELYYYLHHLARWCHDHFAVPMTTPVQWRHPKRLSGDGFVNARGHVGHMHAPGNDHVDPGVGFHIGKVLDFPPPAPRH